MVPRGIDRFLFGVLLGTASAMFISSLLRSNENTPALGGTPSRSESLPPASVKPLQEALRPRVVCFGDSLTQYGFDAQRQGWTALLAHWWERRFDVVNRGFSGYNTRWLLPLVDRLFVPGGSVATKLVMIFLGANDCVLPGHSQHVPIGEYKENLKNMVTHIRRVHPSSKVLLITPPPIHEEKWAAHQSAQNKDMNRKQEVTMAYAQACREVGGEMSVQVVDAFDAMGSGNVVLADKYIHDGVHFSSHGNLALFEAVQSVIIREFPELDPSREGGPAMQAPHWADVNPTNPRESVLRNV